MIDNNTNNSPEEIVADFRKCLRERATNHSQFYRRLSGTPAIKRFTPPNILYGNHIHNSDSDAKEISLPPQPTHSSSSCKLAYDNINQEAKLNVEECKCEDQHVVDASGILQEFHCCPFEKIKSDANMMVVIQTASQLSNNIDQSQSMPICSYDHERDDRIVSATGANVNIGSTSGNSDSDDDIVVINNNNKTCEQDQWNRSNYLTFVRTTSFDRSTHLSRCCHSSRCCTTETNNIRSGLDIDNKNLTVEVDINVTNGEKDDKLNNRSDDQQQQYYTFPCVEKLVKMYTKLLQDKKSELKSDTDRNQKSDSDDKLKSDVNECDNKIDVLQISNDRIEPYRNSPTSDEGCPIWQSPYSSDYDDNDVAQEDAIDSNGKDKEKVLRSSSSDSALGLDDEPPLPSDIPPINQGRRMTLTVTDIPLRPALLPVAEPSTLPDSPTPIDQQQNSGAATGTGALITQTAIPSKVILEERIVEIPEDRFMSQSNSRRESAQSCLSDYNSSEIGGVRYVRTPSVVVSDYSDDVMCGITLEEIEYFRAHRMRRRSSADTTATEKDDAASDVSAASSCSNLYYCGSTISALDGADCYVNGIRMSIDRKISDCSACSTVSGDDEDESYIIHEQEYEEQQDQQQQPITQPIKKQHKKVKPSSELK